MITLSRRSISLKSELAVLEVLAPGGQLTLMQLSTVAGLSKWAARTAVSYLDSRGAVVRTYDRTSWRITETGRGLRTHLRGSGHER